MDQRQPFFDRRNFIKGVIAGGATVSAASYLYPSSSVGAQAPAAGQGDKTMATNTRVLRLDPDFEPKWKKGWAEPMPNTAYHKVYVSEDERVFCGIFCMEPGPSRSSALRV